MVGVRIARVTSKGQMTIPRPAREEAGTEPENLVVVRVVSGMVVIPKAEVRSPLFAGDVLTSLVCGLGKQAEERGAADEEDLDQAVLRAEVPAYEERHGRRE